MEASSCCHNQLTQFPASSPPRRMVGGEAESSNFQSLLVFSADQLPSQRYPRAHQELSHKNKRYYYQEIPRDLEALSATGQRPKTKDASSTLNSVGNYKGFRSLGQRPKPGSLGQRPKYVFLISQYHICTHSFHYFVE